MKPHISILLPAFDAGETLAPCLRSIVRQREARWECLVVDDGSTDRTAEIAAGFARRDSRIRVLTTPHAGLVGALNTALGEASAPYVARMDADDWMHRDRLAQQIAHLRRRPELAGVGCAVRIFPRSSLTPGRIAYERWLNSIDTPERLRREAFVECPVAHPTLMIRRDVLKRHGYRDRGWPEDYDLILRLLRAGEQIDVLPQRLHGWRDHPARLSRTSPDYRIERFVACKAEFISRSFLARAHEYVLWGYGHTGRALCRALAAHDRHPTHIVELHPGRIGQRIANARVIEPRQLVHIDRLPIVVSVAGAGPRGQIRDALAEMGFEEGGDFICAA